MLDTQGNLLPFRQHSPHEVIKLFALGNPATGNKGLFVAYNNTGNNAPLDSDGTYIPQSPGGSFAGAVSYRYATNRTVRPAGSGDFSYNTLGVTLVNVNINDQHGQPLILSPQDRWDELETYPTGMVVPVLRRGLVTLHSRAVLGTPFPGYVGVLTGVGQVVPVEPNDLVSISQSVASGAATAARYSERVAGTFISSSGTLGGSNGGYSQFLVTL